MSQHLPYFDRVLADCLEAMIMEGRSIKSLLDQYPQYQEELAELLTVAKTAHKVPSVKQRPASQPVPKVQVKRQPVVKNAFIDEFLPWLLFMLGQIRPAPQPRYATVSWAMVAALVVTLLMGTGASVAYAADGASPGEPLYGIDRATETIRLSLTFNPEAKAQFGLNLAQERLVELQSLQQSDASLRHIYQALMDYQSQIDTAAEFASQASGHGNQAPAQDLNQAINAVAMAGEQAVANVASSVSAPSYAASRQTSPAETANSPISNDATNQASSAANIAYPALSRANHADSFVGNSSNAFSHLTALELHLNQAQILAGEGKIQEAELELSKYQNQVHLLAQALANSADKDEHSKALQALLHEAFSRHRQVLAKLFDELPPASNAQEGLERALQASNGRGGPDGDRPGNGPPDDVPGNGPPEDKPGGGPPDDIPGNGPPDDKPGGGPPDSNPGGGAPDNPPGRGRDK